MKTNLKWFWFPNLQKLNDHRKPPTFPVRFCKDHVIPYYCIENAVKRMGKGDRKSKKGKLWLGSYGNSRKRTTIKSRLRRRLSSDKPVVAAVEPVEVVVEAKPKVKRTAKKKAEGTE